MEKKQWPGRGRRDEKTVFAQQVMTVWKYLRLCWKWFFSLDGSILPALWLFVCQITFGLCITSQCETTMVAFSALCLCQIDKHTLSFVSLPKNNLRRKNCTVMEVKYCHLSPPKHSQWLLTANHCVSVIQWQLCFQLVFGLILLLSALALARCPHALPHLSSNFFHLSVFVVFFPIHTPQHQHVHVRVKPELLLNLQKSLGTTAGHICFSCWLFFLRLLLLLFLLLQSAT